MVKKENLINEAWSAWSGNDTWKTDGYHTSRTHSWGAGDYLCVCLAIALGLASIIIAVGLPALILHRLW
jgi:hypothetical protein